MQDTGETFLEIKILFKTVMMEFTILLDRLVLKIDHLFCIYANEKPSIYLSRL